jgi:hypothetical protein
MCVDEMEKRGVVAMVSVLKFPGRHTVGDDLDAVES